MGKVIFNVCLLSTAHLLTPGSLLNSSATRFWKSRKHVNSDSLTTSFSSVPLPLWRMMLSSIVIRPRESLPC